MQNLYGPEKDTQLRRILLDAGVDFDQTGCSLAFQPNFLVDRSIDMYSQGTIWCSRERLDHFDFMLRQGCCGWLGSTLADLISHGGRFQLVRQLVESHACINEYSQPFGPFGHRLTPIQAAAHRGEQEMVSYLLQQGANVHQEPHQRNGRTALQAACEWTPSSSNERMRKTDLIKFLLGLCVDINAAPAMKDGLTALGALAIHGELDKASLLVAAGADVNVCFNSYCRAPIDRGRYRALDAAALYGRLDVTSFLINAGALSSDEGLTGYDGAIRLAQEASHHVVANVMCQKATSDFEIFGRNPHRVENTAQIQS